MADPNLVVVTLSEDVLHEIGKVMVQELSIAASKEFTRRKWSIWSGDRRTKITDSFKYKLVSDSSIELTSSFPGIENFVTGTPISRDSEGNIIVKRGGFQAGSAWFHPGIGRKNFLNVGLEKGREAAQKIMVNAALRQWAKGDPFR